MCYKNFQIARRENKTSIYLPVMNNSFAWTFDKLVSIVIIVPHVTVRRLVVCRAVFGSKNDLF